MVHSNSMQIHKCPYCGSEISDEARFCLHCATPLSVQKAEETPKSSFKIKLSLLRFRFPHLFNAKTLSAIGISVGCVILTVCIFSVFVFNTPKNNIPSGGETVNGEQINIPDNNKTPDYTPNLPSNMSENPSVHEMPRDPDNGHNPEDPTIPQFPEDETAPPNEDNSNSIQNSSQDSPAEGTQAPPKDNTSGDSQATSQDNAFGSTQTPPKDTSTETSSVPLKQIEKEEPYVDLDSLKSGNNFVSR